MKRLIIINSNNDPIMYWYNRILSKHAIITLLSLSLCITKPGVQSFLVPKSHTHTSHFSQRHEKRQRSSSSQQLFISTSPSSSSSSSSFSPSNNRENDLNDKSRSSYNPLRIKKQSTWKKKRNHQHEQRRRRSKSSSSDIEKRLQNANYVEERLYQALEKTKDLIVRTRKRLSTTASKSEAETDNTEIISFPSVRECNSALAIMGDTNDFKRALRLFGQMRKSQTLVSLYNNIHDNNSTNNNNNWTDRIYLFPPAPTLVTYSTLMSRAVFLGKERVALRLWRLMILQRQFFTNLNDHNSESSSLSISTSTSTSSKSTTKQQLDMNISSTTFGAPIVPDIKAVNILMNVFAKMADNESAKILMEQIYNGNVQPYDPKLQEVEYLIRVVPKMKANIVTYNTLIDACHRAGDLDSALDALSHMKLNTRLKPDTRTYTSLISTVARRDTLASGAKDPDLAFSLFDEMINVYGIQPNGIVYCALIDVCGRCSRSDLALKVLRMMLRQKEERRKLNNYRNNEVENEVGAWSAAINACGKAGRLDTAIRIFHSMFSKFGVKPNIITCGCLMDCLLKSGKSDYLEEALNILSFMQEEGLEPSEVMYTSLITSAGRLARTENKMRGEIVLPDFGDRTQRNTENMVRMKALDVYEELLLTLTSNQHSNKSKSKSSQNDNMKEASNNLVRAFLIFQEMKATGADPDIACYNALLRACAEAGDIPKLREVMRRIEGDELIPNETSWKECFRGALRVRQSSVAEEFWNAALSYDHGDAESRYKSDFWVPNVDSFVLLLSCYSKQASDEEAIDRKLDLYRKIVDAYVAVLKGYEEKGYNNVDVNLLQQNKRAMSMILKAINIHLEHENTVFFEDNMKLRMLAQDIKRLECLQ